jgi:hypothetical protein
MKHRVIILLLFILTVSFLGAKSPDPKAVVGKIDNITYTYAEYDKILSIITLIIRKNGDIHFLQKKRHN